MSSLRLKWCEVAKRAASDATRGDGGRSEESSPAYSRKQALRKLRRTAADSRLWSQGCREVVPIFAPLDDWPDVIGCQGVAHQMRDVALLVSHMLPDVPVENLMDYVKELSRVETVVCEAQEQRHRKYKACKVTSKAKPKEKIIVQITGMMTDRNLVRSVGKEDTR